MKIGQMQCYQKRDIMDSDDAKKGRHLMKRKTYSIQNKLVSPTIEEDIAHAFTSMSNFNLFPKTAKAEMFESTS